MPVCAIAYPGAPLALERESVNGSTKFRRGRGWNPTPRSAKPVDMSAFEVAEQTLPPCEMEITTVGRETRRLARGCRPCRPAIRRRLHLACLTLRASDAVTLTGLC